MCLFYELWHCSAFQKYSYQSNNIVTLLYSLSYDESLNAVVQSCQIDVGICYWDDVKNLVQTRYFDSKFLQCPNAEMLFEKIKESLTELDESRLIRLSMDGPSVNWNVLEKLDDYLTNMELPETIHIGSCNQHILHRAFQTAIQSSGWNIDKVLSKKGNLLSRRRWRCLSIEVINLSSVLVVHCC